MQTLKLASLFLGASGIMHFVAAALSGFAGNSLMLTVFGVLYIALAALLQKTGSRLLCWVIFLMMLVFSIVALGQTGVGNPVPNWAMYLIVILDWLTAITLFIHLWSAKQATA